MECNTNLWFLCSSFYNNVLDNPVVSVIIRILIVIIIVAFTLKKQYAGMIILLAFILFGNWIRQTATVTEGFFALDYHAEKDSTNEEKSSEFSDTFFKSKKCGLYGGVGGISEVGKNVYYGDRIVNSKYPTPPVSVNDPAFEAITYSYFKEAICKNPSYKDTYDKIIAEYNEAPGKFMNKYVGKVKNAATGKYTYVKDDKGNMVIQTIPRGSDVLNMANYGIRIYNSLCIPTALFKDESRTREFCQSFDFKNEIAKQKCDELRAMNPETIDNIDAKDLTALGVMYNYFSQFSCT
jgi:hypothetical protein